MANSKAYQRVRSSNDSARGQEDDDIEMERIAQSSQSMKKQQPRNGASGRGLMYDVDEEGHRASSDSIRRASEELKDREMLNRMQQSSARRPVSVVEKNHWYRWVWTKINVCLVSTMALHEILFDIPRFTHPVHPPWRRSV